MAGDTMGPGMGPGVPSEAELQHMLAQMREAPAEQVLVEVINVLLQAVQVKLGRPDARLLLDAVAAVTDTVRGRADAQLIDQVVQAVTRLRLAQVEAEAEAPAPTAGPSGGPAPTAPPGPPPASSQGAAQNPPAGQGGSRLWVPGR
jgi:hypothetical protein